MTYAEFSAAIERALAAPPPPLPPTEASPDLRPMVFTLSCISDTIAQSGLADLGQRESLRIAAERCRILAKEPTVRANPDTLAVCSEVIGYLSAVESCRLPVALPDLVNTFSESLRWSVVGLASRAAFAQATARTGRRILSPRLLEVG